MLTRNEKLQRMYACDQTSDGTFITGVLTTGIYCLPSCPARKPKAQNVRFFDVEDEAINAGLRACKRCKPDLYYAGVNPDQTTLLALIAQLKEAPSSINNIASMAAHANMGLSKLYEVVDRFYKTTPGELMHTYRIAFAQQQLRNQKTNIVEIAFDAGYESVSAFYDRFKRTTGLTPAAYRKSHHV